MSKPIYDLMVCADGATRAVPVINGVKVDPTLEVVKKQEDLEKKEAEKKIRPKLSIQDRIQNQVEDFISVVEGQADDFVDSGYKMKYDVYGDLINRGCKSVHARKMRPFYIDCYMSLLMYIIKMMNMC